MPCMLPAHNLFTGEVACSYWKLFAFILCHLAMAVGRGGCPSPVEGRCENSAHGLLCFFLWLLLSGVHHCVAIFNRFLHAKTRSKCQAWPYNLRHLD